MQCADFPGRGRRVARPRFVSRGLHLPLFASLLLWVGCGEAALDADARVSSDGAALVDGGQALDGGRAGDAAAPRDGQATGPDGSPADAGDARDGAQDRADAGGALDGSARDGATLDGAIAPPDAGPGGADAGLAADAGSDVDGGTTVGRWYDGRRIQRDVIMPERPYCCTTGLEIDEDDDLVVTAGVFNTVIGVDPDTSATTLIGDPREPEASRIVVPWDVWRDPETGDLYITEYLTGGIRKVEPDETRTRVLHAFNDPTTAGLARPFGITGFRPAGGSLRLFITMQCTCPEGVAGVWEVDPNGVVPPVLVFGAAGGTPLVGHPALNSPSAVAVSPSGTELFVSELYGGEVWAYHLTLRTHRQVYEGGGLPRSTASGVRFGPSGRLYYTEIDTGVVATLNPAGPASQTPAVVVRLQPGVHRVVEASDGTLYATNPHIGGVSAYHPSSGVRQLFPLSLNVPEGLAPLPDGRVAIAELPTLGVVDPSRPLGERVQRVKRVFADDFDLSVGAAATSACDVYVGQFFRGTIAHVDLCAPTREHIEILPRMTFAVGGGILAWSDALWVADLGSGTVSRVTGVSGADTASRSVFAAGLVEPVSIAGFGDTVYASDRGANSVIRYNAATGTTRGSWTGFSRPEGITAEPDGSVLVIEADVGELTRVRADGTRETVADGLESDVIELLPSLGYFNNVVFADDPEAIFISLPQTGSLVRLTPAP